jgi:hypothetical protein
MWWRTHKDGHVEAVETLLGEHVDGRGDVDVGDWQCARHPSLGYPAVPSSQLHLVLRSFGLELFEHRVMH